MTKLALALTLLIGACGTETANVSCVPCGDGSITCDGPIADCIGSAECDTNGPGSLVLHSDGTYAQTYADGSMGAGTYAIDDNGISMSSGGLIPVFINSCPWH